MGALVATAALVFLRAWQQQNVIHGHYLAAALTSYAMAAAEIGVVLAVVAPCYCTGGYFAVNGQADVLRDYYAFLSQKKRSARPRGFDLTLDVNPSMFGFQADVLQFLIGIGCGAAFLDTGLGKSIIELEWCRHVHHHTGRPVLMLAPLAVGPQHEREGVKFGIEAKYIRHPGDMVPGINICNYERLHLFDASRFGGLCLDESSIIKAFGGKTTKALMQFAEHIPYRLAATATPAPNDHMELGQHSQLLGVMESNEMLARWFTADQSEMGRYRLKRYGVEDFWAWVSSWARMATRPSDLGHDDAGFALPELHRHVHYVDADLTAGADDGALFRAVDMSATSYHKEKRITAALRAERIAEIVRAEPEESWVIWCDTDYEADELTARLPEAVEVRGSHRPELKEQRLVDFSEGRERVLITKPRIAGFGLNWQHCARCAFTGLSFSYEQYYQAVRRFWRFGQRRPVDVHIALANTEAVVLHTVQRKARAHESMKGAMARAMSTAMQVADTKINYRPTAVARLPHWLKSA